MRLLVGRISGALFLGVWIAAAGLHAQTSTAAPDAEAKPAAAPVSTTPAGADATGAGAASGNALDYLFNHKAQNGTAAKEVYDANNQSKLKAEAQEATGNRMTDAQMQARFNTYLGMSEVSQTDIKTYAAGLEEVTRFLAKGQTFEAWRKLNDLAGYETIDAGLSGELANRVESIWDADKTNQMLDKQNKNLRDNADTASRNADMMSDDIRDKEIEYQRRMMYAQGKKGASRANPPQTTSPNGGVPQVNPNSDTTLTPPPDVSGVMGRLELTDQYLDSLQAKAKIKLNEMKAEKLMDKAKNDFGDYITTLFQSGCYRHVLVAAGFYRTVFDQGEYPVSMARQVNASLQTTRDVQNSLNVFHNQIEDNEIAAATDSLQQAFMANEFDPTLLGIELSEKKKVAAFAKCLVKMQNLIEARDFTNLEAMLQDVKKIAPDFDTTKPMAIVGAVKLESQLRLGKAKMAAQQGDLKTAMEEFQGAAESWPGNPDLKDKALSFFNSQDVQTQSLTEFDRLVSENNYRGIFDKQLTFAPAMKDDLKRQQLLKDALLKVQQAETAIQKANLLATNGNVCGAWETVELAAKDLPDDLKLNSLRGQMAGRGAEFVSAISKAKDAEAKNEFGYSLTWYAIAQRSYPASSMANEGIERLSKQILAKQL